MSGPLTRPRRLPYGSAPASLGDAEEDDPVDRRLDGEVQVVDRKVIVSDRDVPGEFVAPALDLRRNSASTSEVPRLPFVSSA